MKKRKTEDLGGETKINYLTDEVFHIVKFIHKPSDFVPLLRTSKSLRHTILNRICAVKGARERCLQNIEFQWNWRNMAKEKEIVRKTVYPYVLNLAIIGSDFGKYVFDHQEHMQEHLLDDEFVEFEDDEDTPEGSDDFVTDRMISKCIPNVFDLKFYSCGILVFQKIRKSGLLHLRSLTFHSCWKFKSNPTGLLVLGHLERITLISTDVKGKLFRNLVNLKHIKASHSSCCGGDWMKHLKNLESIDLFSADELRWSRLEKLKDLRLVHCRDPIPLSECPNLERLDVKYAPRIVLTHSKNLVDLRFVPYKPEHDIHDKDLLGLDKLQRLYSGSPFITGKTFPSSLRHLTVSVRCSELDFKYLECVEYLKFHDCGKRLHKKCFPSKNQIRELVICDSRIGVFPKKKSSEPFFQKLSKLKVISFSGCSVNFSVACLTEYCPSLEMAKFTSCFIGKLFKGEKLKGVCSLVIDNEVLKDDQTSIAYDEMQ